MNTLAKDVSLMVDTINAVDENAQRALKHFAEMVENGRIDQENATEVAVALSSILTHIQNTREILKGRQ